MRTFFPLALLGLSLVAASSMAAPATSSAGVEGVAGVKQEGAAQVKPVENGSIAVPPPKAQGVEKIDGVETVKGVKAAGDATPPPAPVAHPATPVAGPGSNAAMPPPKAKGVEKVEGVEAAAGVKGPGHAAGVPPPAAKAVAPPAPGMKPLPPPGKAGSGASVRPVDGVAGIDGEKLKNLEAALKVQHVGKGVGEAHKAKAAAGLLTVPVPAPKAGPKNDGRDLLQNFDKIPDTGS